MSEGRQDIVSPEPPLEESNPIPVQQAQGQRLWLWITLVGLLFVVIIAAVLIAR